MQTEFTHIQDALAAIAAGYGRSTYTEVEIQSICSAFHFTKAESLINISSAGKNISFSSVMQILSRSRADAEKISAVIEWNIKPNGPPAKRVSFVDNLCPYSFYNRSSFRFDGKYITAQYFYTHGLGMVLQLGGEVVGPLHIALTRKRLGKSFSFQMSNSGWNLLYLFAGDTAKDGPEFLGYSTMDEARDAYNKAQQDAQREAEFEMEQMKMMARYSEDGDQTRSSSEMKSNVDSDDGDLTESSFSETSFDIL